MDLQHDATALNAQQNFIPVFPAKKCLVFPFNSQRLPPPTPWYQQWQIHGLHTLALICLYQMDIPDIFKEKSKKIWQNLVIWHSKQVTNPSIISCIAIS